MSTPTFTRSMKRKIAERVEDRADTVEERLMDISSGETAPTLNQMRLNEAKQFRLGMVFIDINGFSRYVLDNSDEQVLKMLSIFIPEVLQIVRDYGGYFEKNTGDGILAYFGAGETDSESVSTLLDYLATVKWALANQINPLFEENGIEPISISSGATYGSTYVSRIGVKSGNQQMNRLTAVSETANFAARLEEEADENEYLVGPRVKYHANDSGWEGMFSYKDVWGYKWKPESETKDREYIIRDFYGKWESTLSSNLVV